MRYRISNPATTRRFSCGTTRTVLKPRGRWRGSMQAIIYGYKSLKASVFHEDEARVPYTPGAAKLRHKLLLAKGE